MTKTPAAPVAPVAPIKPFFASREPVAVTVKTGVRAGRSAMEQEQK